jgi:hypothetical protein
MKTLSVTSCVVILAAGCISPSRDASRVHTPPGTAPTGRDALLNRYVLRSDDAGRIQVLRLRRVARTWSSLAHRFAPDSESSYVWFETSKEWPPHKDRLLGPGPLLRATQHDHVESGDWLLRPTGDGAYEVMEVERPLLLRELVGPEPWQKRPEPGRRSKLAFVGTMYRHKFTDVRAAIDAMKRGVVDGPGDEACWELPEALHREYSSVLLYRTPRKPTGAQEAGT